MSVADRAGQSAQYLKHGEIHEQWESHYLNRELDKLYGQVFERIVGLIGPAKGLRLLDAGCGYGLHAIRLAKSGAHIIGVDFSEAALEAARRNVEQAGLVESIELRHADLLDLPFADGAFDIVHCWGVLMHIPELERALNELTRVLAPRGKLIVMENNEASLHVRVYEPLVRYAKRALERPLAERRRTERGIEEWVRKDEGGLLVRKLDVDYLMRFMTERKLELVARLPVQFTELYTNMPSAWLKRLVYSWNRPGLHTSAGQSWRLAMCSHSSAARRTGRRTCPCDPADSHTPRGRNDDSLGRAAR